MQVTHILLVDWSVSVHSCTFLVASRNLKANLICYLMKLISPDTTRAYWKTTITHTWGVTNAAFLSSVWLGSISEHSPFTTQTSISLVGYGTFPADLLQVLKSNLTSHFFIHNTLTILLNWSDSQRVGWQVVHFPWSLRAYLPFFKTEVNHTFLSLIANIWNNGHTMTNQPTLMGIQKSYTDTYLLFKFIYTVTHTLHHTHTCTMKYLQHGEAT